MDRSCSEPPAKLRRGESGGIDSRPSAPELAPVAVKVLLLDHTLPTTAERGVVREVVFGERNALLNASHSQHPGAATFRRRFVDALSPPQLIETSVLLDVDVTLLEVWDDTFLRFVPLTSSELLLTSSEFQQHNALRIRLTTPGHHAPTTSGPVDHHTSGSPHTGVLQRECTFLGSSAMVRLPTRDHHSLIPREECHASSTYMMTPASSNNNNTSRVRILLVRHGESQGNVTPSIYNTVPDHAIPLTEGGCKMAQDTGRFLKQYFEENNVSKKQLGHHVRLLVSPYERTRQTAQNILKTLNDKTCSPADRWVDSVKELPYLAEQDFGLSEGDGTAARSKCTEELVRIDLQRKHRGKFWSRFPHGESPFDVAVRMSGVLSEIIGGCTSTTTSRAQIRTFIIVSHGITVRAFIAAWCGKSPEWLSDSRNPPNCSVQLVEDVGYAGYVFGGFEHGKAVKADEIELQPDPRQDAWKDFL